MADEPQQENPTQFDLKVLLAQEVDAAVAEFIRRLGGRPGEVKPDELRDAIRRWFSAGETSLAWLHLVDDWQNGRGAITIGDSTYIWGPRNPAWRAAFIHTLTIEYQKRLDMFDVVSQLGGMLGIVKRKDSWTGDFAKVGGD